MIIIESFMLTCLICTSMIAMYTDFKGGVIRNKLLVIAGVIIVILDIIYYSLICRDMSLQFVINLIATIILSIVLYFTHFWGAGDSKFMMLIVASIPSRFYLETAYSLPTLFIIIQTFSISFVYLFFESIVLGIKYKRITMSLPKVDLVRLIHIIKNYLVSYIYIFLLSFILSIIFRGIADLNPVIVPICNFFIILAVLNLDFFQKKWVIAAALVIDIILALFFSNWHSFMPSGWNLLLIAIVLFMKAFSEQYNYQEIKTCDIKSGMILSVQTVMMFKSSRVKGLPENTTEDYRSRITDEEVASIKRWENSKNGCHEILIVRKIPFAVFIFIGTMIFLASRM